jgi:serine/threonine protein kinase
MNSAHDNRGKRLIEVFNEARALPVGEQLERFLDEACGKDEQFRAELHSLLRAGHSGGDYLQGGPPVATQLEAQFERLKPEEPGEFIGNYKLLQQIGHGGFGTVWMAQQHEPVRRRVALKIIKLGMDTKEVIARFEQERQALAMMDHPNIARVFDAGATATGRPYFVMELVRGVKITEYCDEQQLSTDERIDLFVHVCHAVQHAHQKGIIHRDLKPSNILVTINDGAAVPKVIDFGVAKAMQGRLTDSTVFTQFEQMIGTPLYMSPEQAEMTSLDIDTRSDIYSLGVLLYELLTGRTPIDTSTLARAGMDEIRRIIREVDPPKPSARLKTLDGNELTTAAKRRHTDAARLPRSLRGDIDWIVMKCLEKDRKRRYDTANGVAADLQRHLRNEVVVARPPTATYLLSKLIKRNKLAFAAAAAIVASLMAGMAATVWQLVQTRRAEKRVVATLDELRKTAPAFAEQARALAAKEHYEEAIQKLNYAIELRPDAAEYYVAKADLLQCQLSPRKLAEAAAVYREAMRVQPGLARAEQSAKLCDELLAAKPTEQGNLTRESLAKLHVAMQRQQRPAAELLPAARLLGEEKKLLLEYWVARLKELPVPAEYPLEKRLTMREMAGWRSTSAIQRSATLRLLQGRPWPSSTFHAARN